MVLLEIFVYRWSTALDSNHDKTGYQIARNWSPFLSVPQPNVGHIMFCYIFRQSSRFGTLHNRLKQCKHVLDFSWNPSWKSVQLNLLCYGRDKQSWVKGIITTYAALLDPHQTLQTNTTGISICIFKFVIRLSSHTCEIFIQGEVTGLQVLLDSPYPHSTRASWWSPVLQKEVVKNFDVFHLAFAECGQTGRVLDYGRKVWLLGCPSHLIIAHMVVPFDSTVFTNTSN